MSDLYEIVPITPEQLPIVAMEKKAQGGRLVQICATRRPNGYEVLYSFDVETQLYNYRLDIDEDVEVASISDIFPPAFLYENEVSELFGVKIKGISIDFQGKLYRIEAETPFKD